jgi:hypothetical protein
MNKHFFYILSGLAILACLGAACTGSPMTPTPTEALVQTSATLDPPSATATPKPTEPPAPTATPEPTDTPQPTASPTPTLDLTATAQAEATAAAEAALAVVGKELEKVGMSTDSGHLLWAQDEPLAIEMDEYQEWTFEPFAEGMVASDFVVKSDITWDSTSGLVTCGFFYRSEENLEEGKQYLYEMYRLSGLPAYELTYLQYGDYQKSLSKIQTSEAIDQEQGSTNEVILIAEGEKFTLYINGLNAGSYYDYSKNMLEGYFAYSAWQESGKSTCSFANTWVWALK